jgi:hypothetical protein
MKPDDRTTVAAIEAVREERLRRAEDGPAFRYFMSVLESRLAACGHIVVVGTPGTDGGPRE